MNRYMLMAIKEAKTGIKFGHGGPFGAIIVKDGQLVAKAHNEVIKNNDCTCHGEMRAIEKACKKLQTYDLSGCDIYTTGEPCPMCMGAIMWANIKNIYYGCSILDAESIGFRDERFYKLLNFNTKQMDNIFQIDREDCYKVFEEYKNIQDKKSY